MIIITYLNKIVSNYLRHIRSASKLMVSLENGKGRVCDVFNLLWYNVWHGAVSPMYCVLFACLG